MKNYGLSKKLLKLGLNQVSSQTTVKRPIFNQFQPTTLTVLETKDWCPTARRRAGAALMLLQSINSLTPNGSSSRTWETFALILIGLKYLTLHGGSATNFFLEIF